MEVVERENASHRPKTASLMDPRNANHPQKMKVND